MTTASLLERATETRSKDVVAAALLAAEALRLSPLDDRARAELGALVAEAGRVTEGVQILLLAADRLGAAGFVLSAIAACRSAFDSAPADPRIDALLRQLHGRIAGRAAGIRARVPPPAIPQPVTEDDPETLVGGGDPSSLFSRAIQLGLSPPPPVVAVEAAPVPLFSEIGEAAFVSLVKAMIHRRHGSGAVLVGEGEQGTSVFVLVQGDVRVERARENEAQILAHLGGGSIFGEMALITDQPRSASVIAQTPVELFEIGQREIETTAASHPAIGPELSDFARRRILRNLLETSPLFTPLEARDRLEILRSFKARVVPAGTDLILEGSTPTGLFVVAAGQVRITKIDPGGDTILLAELHDGEVFGEIGLLEDGLTTATASATRKTVVLHLERQRFQEIIARHPAMKAYLASLSRDRLRELQSAAEQTAEAIDADELIVV